MKKLLLLTVLGLSLIACKKDYKSLGSDDVELSASSDGLFSVSYTDESGETIRLDSIRQGHYVRMNKPNDLEVRLRATALDSNQRLILKIMKDRHTMEYEDVRDDYHTVELTYK